jgi:DNA-directed RNA polymerase I subunit RPA43
MATDLHSTVASLFGEPSAVAASASSPAPDQKPRKPGSGRPRKNPEEWDGDKRKPKEKKVKPRKEASAEPKAKGKVGRPRKRPLDEDEAATAGAERESEAKRRRTDEVVVDINGYEDEEGEHDAEDKEYDEESRRRITKYSYAEASGTNFAASKTQAIPGVPAELQSPFVSTTVSWKVTVPPVAAMYPLEGVLAQFISPLLLTWHPQLNGILLAYNHAQLHTKAPQGQQINIKTLEEEEPMAESVDECAAPYVWLTLSALIFKPAKGLEMEGYLSLQNESHITLILWNFFTVTISHKRVPRSWRWRDYYDEDGNPTASAPSSINGDVEAATHRKSEQYGSWHDANDRPIEGFLRFRIKDWDCSPAGIDGDGSFLSVEGSMLTDEEEQELKVRNEREKERKKLARRARLGTPLQSALKGGSAAAAASTAAATTNGTTPKSGRKKK